MISNQNTRQRNTRTHAAAEVLEMMQFDFKAAFLNGDLEEEIPEGMDDGNGKVCRLKKCLYGLNRHREHGTQNLPIF